MLDGDVGALVFGKDPRKAAVVFPKLMGRTAVASVLAGRCWGAGYIERLLVECGCGTHEL